MFKLAGSQRDDWLSQKEIRWSWSGHLQEVICAYAKHDISCGHRQQDDDVFTLFTNTRASQGQRSQGHREAEITKASGDRDHKGITRQRSQRPQEAEIARASGGGDQQLPWLTSWYHADSWGCQKGEDGKELQPRLCLLAFIVFICYVVCYSFTFQWLMCCAVCVFVCLFVCLCVWTVRPMHVQLHEGQDMCAVCSDVANGIHFGAVTCEGCKVHGL